MIAYKTNVEIANEIDNIRRLFTDQLNFIPLATLINQYLENDRACFKIEDNHIVAYLLHGALKKGHSCALTQVANAPGHYYGLQLFRQFRNKAIGAGCTAIRIRCAETVSVRWESLGFSVRATEPAHNSRQRRILIYWMELDGSNRLPFIFEESI